jgi:hypothetical protein
LLGSIPTRDGELSTRRWHDDDAGAAAARARRALQQQQHDGDHAADGRDEKEAQEVSHRVHLVASRLVASRKREHARTR